MKIVKLAASLLILMAMSSCEGYEIFEDELYMKIVSVLSTEDNKIYPETHSFENKESVGHVAIAVSGTNPIEKAETVELELDPEAIDEYNERMFGLDESKYIKAMDPKYYSIPSNTITIEPVGNPPRALFPITIKPEGLSPDELYLIPLRIKSSSVDSIHSEYNSVMYRVYLKNKFADAREETLYVMKGEKRESENGAPYKIMINKVAYPISVNEIRFSFEQKNIDYHNMDEVKHNTFVLKISDNGDLSVRPYVSDFVDVELVNGDPVYNNKYRTDVAGNYRMYVNYRYRTRGSASDEWGNWSYIKENLMEYVELNN